MPEAPHTPNLERIPESLPAKDAAAAERETGGHAMDRPPKTDNATDELRHQALMLMPRDDDLDHLPARNTGRCSPRVTGR
jgi:hypothetical protein